MKTEPKLSYSENHVIFSSKWTVEDLQNAIKYQNDDSISSLSDQQVDELGDMVSDAVQKAIEDFMNAYF